jgi:hypothetical protein
MSVYMKDIVGSLNDLNVDIHGCFDNCDLLSEMVSLTSTMKIKCCQSNNCNKNSPSLTTTKQPTTTVGKKLL